MSETRANRKSRTGEVVKTGADKTIVVAIRDRVRHRLVTLRDGREYRLEISVGPDLSRYFEGKVRLRSDHPDLPLKEIPFRGWTKRR